MNEDKVFKEVDRLRSEERMTRLEPGEVVRLCLTGSNPQSVLDVGTGSGLFAETFQAAGLQIAGIDINPTMLEAARKYVPEGNFQEAAAENLPFPDNSFDLVFLGMVLHETNDPAKALREAGRVSRGLVAILEWPYLTQEFGPPLAHRLTVQNIEEFAKKSNLQNLELFSLSNMVLYRLSK